jgi:hypothetical protein
MQDLKQQIKDLFLNYYDPKGTFPSHLSTKEIYTMLLGVLPSKPITEYDIYEALKEMGFQQVLVIKTVDEKIFEGDELDGTTDEIDKNEVEKIFLWEVFEK